MCLLHLFYLMAIPKERLLRWEKRHSALDLLPSPQTPPKHDYSQYANRQLIGLDKHLHAHQKQKIRRQQLQNKRLLRKLSQIGNRKQSLGRVQGDMQVQQMYVVNMRSRRKQREKREQTLQYQNDILVERIVRMRRNSSGIIRGSGGGEGKGSTSPRSPSEHSLMLPSIHQEYHYV